MVIVDEVLVPVRVTILVGANAFDEDTTSADRRRVRDDFICIYVVCLFVCLNV